MSATLPDDERTDVELKPEDRLQQQSKPEDRLQQQLKVAWRRAATETRAVLRQGSAAWRKHSCPGTAECCQLAITKREPWLWPSEWKVIEERLARDRRPIPGPRADGACPLLDKEGKRCSVYDDRPLGCRTYFCHRIIGPEKLPGDETNALLERLRALNVAVDDAASPRSISTWLGENGTEKRR